MNRPGFVVAFALLAFPLLSAQQPRHSESIEVRLLEVDVTVTDRTGNPVNGLIASDFDLFVNGEREEISNFSEYRESDQRQPKPSADARAASRSDGTPPIDNVRPRTIVLLLDSMRVRRGDSSHLYDTIRRLLQDTVRPGDHLTVFGWLIHSGFKPIAEITGPEQIGKVMTTLESNVHAENGRGPSPQDILSFEATAAAMGPQQISRLGSGATQAPATAPATGGIGPATGGIGSGAGGVPEEDFAEMGRKTASMERIVSSLGSPRSRNAVIYVSDKFPRIAGKKAMIGTRALNNTPISNEQRYDTSRMIAAVVSAANANNVAFYALRPNIPNNTGTNYSARDDSALVATIAPGTEAAADAVELQNEITALNNLTEPTGGSVGVGPKGIEQIADRISRDLGSYYSLAWRARSDGSDRERKVTVRAKNRDYVVHSRATVVEKSDKTRAADLLVSRLFESEASNDLEFDVTTGQPGPAARGQVLVPVELKIPRDQLKFMPDGGESVARFSILSVAGSSIGQTTAVTHDSHRINASKDQNASDGFIHYTLQILTDRKPTTFAIGVYDENSGSMGVRKIALGGGAASVAPVAVDATADAAWREAAERGAGSRKPLVVFFRPQRCRPCDAFQRDSVPHPTIARRMGGVEFATIPFSEGGAGSHWPSKDPGIALFDRAGTLRVKWVGVPDTTMLGIILDGVIAAAPHFDAAAALDEQTPGAGASHLAVGLVMLGRPAEARTALQEAIGSADVEASQLAAVALAELDAGQGKAAESLAKLHSIVSVAKTPHVAAEAWVGIGEITRIAGPSEEAAAAYRHAIEVAGADSPTGISAAAALASLPSSGPRVDALVIRVLPPAQLIVTGRQTVHTLVNSPAVARVVFTLDGTKVASVTEPPFSTTVQFSRIPHPQAVGVVAYDANGGVLGRDERWFNAAGDAFWVRLDESIIGKTGTLPVSITLQAPAARRVDSVTISWNDKTMAVLKSAPWTTQVAIPGEAGVLRAVARLDDGQTTEDAIPLNSGAYGERTAVEVVELPVTITENGKAVPQLSAAQLNVLEGQTQRAIEAITPGAETPITVGVLIDTSSSMEKRLPDVQEAAIRFLDSILSPADRALVIEFNSTAALVQGATTDRELLRRAIMSLAPHGETALNDAMILGLLQFEGIKGRRALVVFTDGMDVTSRYSAKDVTQSAQRMSVPIYAIAAPLPLHAQLMAAPSDPGSPRAGGIGSSRPPSATEQAEADLRAVTRLSGGEYHGLGGLDRLGAIYDQIADALRAQMLITIRTVAATDANEWRALKITANDRKLSIRAPAGYYAPQ